MNTPFGRAFRYEMQNYFRAVAVLWLAMALIPAAMMALAYFLAGETAAESSFNGYSMAVGMFGLVLGMVGLRENQRVLNQNGVSRRSAFLADMAALAVAALLVAVGVSVIMGIYRAVLGSGSHLLITDLYQLIYSSARRKRCGGAGPGSGPLHGGGLDAGGPGAVLLRPVLAAEQVLDHFGLRGRAPGADLRQRAAAHLAGHHLRRTGGGGGPGGLRAVPGRLPWNAAAVLLAMGIVFFALSWLLLRRAMIRPAK